MAIWDSISSTVPPAAGRVLSGVMCKHIEIVRKRQKKARHSLPGQSCEWHTAPAFQERLGISDISSCRRPGCRGRTRWKATVASSGIHADSRSATTPRSDEPHGASLHYCHEKQTHKERPTTWNHSKETTAEPQSYSPNYVFSSFFHAWLDLNVKYICVCVHVLLPILIMQSLTSDQHLLDR